ncbi:hypothetical protein IKE72_02665 [Candidatus Saccharibacteria bacterium]|nr:hypothetical protein [Candidatus Saccharibacteria bacterium]
MLNWEISKVCSEDAVSAFIDGLKKPIAVLIFGPHSEAKVDITSKMMENMEERLGEDGIVISLWNSGGGILFPEEDYEIYEDCLHSYANVVGIFVCPSRKKKTSFNFSQFFKEGEQTRPIDGIDWLITVTSGAPRN